MLITDVKLPGMDGVEFLRAARATAPALPVILISGGYGYDELTYKEEGAFGYLPKPFRAEELEEMVTSALGRGGGAGGGKRSMWPPWNHSPRGGRERRRSLRRGRLSQMFRSYAPLNNR